MKTTHEKSKRKTVYEDDRIEVLDDGPSIEEPEVSDDVELGEEEVIDLSTPDHPSLDRFLPVIAPSRELDVVRPEGDTDIFKLYLREISRYPLLSPEREKALIKSLIETGDIEVAKELVRANLRLVVKIAMEYRHAYQNVMDLIQEGNIGLMKAVSKFDPSKNAKLSYYSSWWIRSYILKFILDNFRLVKIGTTQDQKKLFYNLLREKERLVRLGIDPSAKALSDSLGVSEKAVVEMDQRLSSSGGELSLDYSLPSEQGGGTTLADLIANDDIAIDEALGEQQGVDILKSKLKDFLETLKPRDREIFEKRLLSETPPTLQAIADEYGVSRERIRQVEERLMSKLKVYMAEFIR